MPGSIGAYIRLLRLQRGWSQEDLARALCLAAGRAGRPLGRQEISRWERGRRTPRDWLPVLTVVLGVSETDLIAAVSAHTAPSSLPDYLAEVENAAPSAPRGRLGASAVEDLAGRVHGLRLADDVMSGGDLIRPALRELRRGVRLYRDHTHTEAVGRALLAQVGELAQITGWICSDAGRHDAAERIYRLGLSAAEQAADPVLMGNIAGSLAYQWSNIGREAEALLLARAAVDMAGPDAPATARALYWDRVAWAHARSGQAQPAMGALGQAAEAMDHGCGDDGPRYLYWMSHGELRIMEARVYTELRRPLRAVPLLREVLSGYDTSRTRELALYLSWLAIALADADEPEEAAAVAERVIALSEPLTSSRAKGRVRKVLIRLASYADVPEVRTLLSTRVSDDLGEEARLRAEARWQGRRR